MRFLWMVGAVAAGSCLRERLDVVTLSAHTAEIGPGVGAASGGTDDVVDLGAGAGAARESELTRWVTAQDLRS